MDAAAPHRRRLLRLLILFGVVAACVIVAGGHRPTFAAVTPGPTAVCDLPDGDVVWTAVGSPYLICPDGLWVGHATRLTIDVTAGPVEVRATGQGGVILHGEIRTTGTTTGKGVLFAPLTSTTPGGWDGISGGGRATLSDTTIRYAEAPLWVGSFDATRVAIESSSSTAVTGRGRIVDSIIDTAGAGADFGDPPPVSGILADGPLEVRNVTFEDLADSAIVQHRADRGPIRVEQSRFTRVGTSGVPAVLVDGVYALGDQRPIVRDNVFRASSLAAEPGRRAPTIHIGRMWVDLTSEVVRNTGSGNGLNVVLLDQVWTATGFTWTSPHASALDAQLGIVTTALTVEGGVVTIPAGGVAKVVDGGIDLIRSRLVAGALSTITSARDNRVGVALCPSTIVETCTPSADDWRGVAAHGAGDADPVIDLDVATIRYAVQALDVESRTDAPFPAGSTTVSMTDATIRDVRSGIRTTGARRIVITRGAFRDVTGGPDPFWGSMTTGRAVDVSGAGGLAISGTSLRDVRGEAVWVNGGPLQVMGATIERAGLVGRSAIYAIHVTDPDLSNTTILESGTGGPGRPAVELFSIGGDLGRGLVGLRGARNGVDAVVLSSTNATGDLTWITPRASTVTAPLGYIDGGLVLSGGATLTVPSGGTLHSLGRLRLQGAHLDAAAGGATFTTVDDPDGGSVACASADVWIGSVVRPSMGCERSAWYGIELADGADGVLGTATVRGARFRRATDAITVSSSARSSRWSPAYGVVLDGVVVEDSGAGAFLGNGTTSIVGSTFRRLQRVAIVGGGRGALHVEGNLIEDVQDGVSFDGRGGGHVEVVGNTFRRLTGTSVHLHVASDPILRSNAVQESPAFVAFWIRNSTVSLGDGVAGNTVASGAGPTVVLLDGGLVIGESVWQSPRAPSDVPEPLGHLIGHDDVGVRSGGTLRLPAGAVVKSYAGELSVASGGHLDASAGGAVFTAAFDDTAGVALCAGARGGTCAAVGSWRGLRAQPPSAGALPTLLLRSAEVRHAPVAVRAAAWPTDGAPIAPAVDWEGGAIRASEAGVRSWDAAVRLAGVAVTGASSAGLEASGGAVRISCSSVFGNGVGLKTGPGTTLVVSDSNLTGNVPEVHADAGAVVDARRNWWGQPGGPVPGQVTGGGSVDTGEPRSSRATCAPGYPSSFDGLPTTTTSTTTTTTTSITTTTSTTMTSTPTTTRPPATTTTTRPVAPVPPPSTGYAMVDAAGHVYPFGDAPWLGNAAVGGVPAIDIELTRTNRGYWVVDAAGHVFTFGDAPYLGGAGPLRAQESVTSLSATPDGSGYWLFTTAGRALAFGTAPLLGDMSSTRLNGPVLDSVPTPSGRGYYMVASDGGIFTFGDARFEGSMGGIPLNAPVQSLVPDPDGSGYWLVASDGGIFTFASEFYGSMGSVRLNRPVTGMVGGRRGYLMVAEDGGIFTFGDIVFSGSLGANPPARPVAAVASVK